MKKVNYKMKCSFCNRKSVYFRSNEGHHYCDRHFTRNIEKRVKRTLGEYNLIEKGDRVAVALSGGKDSSNTLFILNKIFKNNPHVDLFAITLDEGIHGYRDKTLKNAKKFCKQLEIEHHIFSFKKEFGITVDQLAKKMKSGFCGSCGVLRRYLLNKKARELKATKLATGHNLDDECQSILMNVLKGDLLRFARLGPIPRLASHPKFVTRIKPLIMIPESESKLYATLNKIPAYFDKCRYSFDDPLRGETRDFLNRVEKSSPGIKYSLLKSAYRIVPFIKTRFKTGKIGSCKKCGEPTSQDVCKVCVLLETMR